MPLVRRSSYVSLTLSARPSTPLDGGSSLTRKRRKCGTAGTACGLSSVAEEALPLPSSFGALLRDLVAWLEAAQVEGVVIGGLAAGILGRPRLTAMSTCLSLWSPDAGLSSLPAEIDLALSPGSKTPLASRSGTGFSSYDIEGVLARNPGLDLGRAQSWIREFSAALDRPEIFEDFQAIVRKVRS